jgi:N6-L-threonylcarbamoyladenine synthase
VTFVAEEAGDLLGELVAVPRGAHILGLGVSVAEAHRRRGVATALFGEIEALARDAGVTELELDVQEVNEPARALYDALGFADTGRRREGERGTVLTLSKTLRA